MAGEKIIDTRINIKAGDTFVTCQEADWVDGMRLPNNTKFDVISLNPPEGQPEGTIQVNYTNLDDGWKGSLHYAEVTLEELEDQINIPGAIVSFNDEPVKVVPEADAILESYTLDNMKTTLIPTGLYGKDNLAIFNSLAGQLSDGMWENSSRMTKYWEYMDYQLGEDDQVMIRVPKDYRWWLGFESPSAIKKWIADHLKALVKEYIKYNEGEWSRDCDIRVEGWFNRPEPEIREVYRVYDKLLGRKDRVGSTYNYLENYNSLDNKSLEESTSFDYLNSINFKDPYFYYLNQADENGWVTYTVSNEDDPKLDAENMVYEEFDTWEDAKKFAQEHNIDRIIVNAFGWEGPNGYDNGDYIEFDEQWLNLNHELLDKENYLDNLNTLYLENLGENWRPNNLTTIYSIEHLPLERGDTYYKVRSNTSYDKLNLIIYITRKGFRVDITPAIGKGAETGCASLMFKSIPEAQEFLRKAGIPESKVEIYLTRFSPLDYESGLWKLNTELGETYVAGYRLGSNELFRSISDPDTVLEKLVTDTVKARYNEDTNKSSDYKEKFDERTHAHIDRVNKYAKKIGKEYPHHDEDKFNELYDGYSLMSKNKEDITKEEQAMIDDATFKHVINNEHHCEHWVDPKDIEGFSRDNPTPHGCLDCSKMPESALEEMCCDWCAMSEEFNNTPFEWYKKNKDTRWHFNEEQDKFILDTLHKLWDEDLEEDIEKSKYFVTYKGKGNLSKAFYNIDKAIDYCKTTNGLYVIEERPGYEEPLLAWEPQAVNNDKDDDLEEDINNNMRGKIKEILDKYNSEKTSRISLFEVDPDKIWIEHFDDGDIDFSKFSEHTQSDNKSKYYSFMITGGLNGSGEWDDYLEDIKKIFVELKDKLNLEPVLYSVDTDIADDVWTGKVFLYEDPTENQLKESLLYNDLEEDYYDEPAVKVAKRIAKALKLSKYDLNTLIHDINNLRGSEWLEQVESIGDEELLKQFKEVAQLDLEEDIEKHDTLNQKLFDGEELKPEVKETINKIVDQFISELANDGIKFSLKDIVLLGSNVSYNYTKDSDLDIHLIANSSDLTCPDNLYPLLYSAYRSMFNSSYNITINGIPAELYVEMDEPQAKSNGIYSLNTGWIKKPTQQTIPNLDKEAFDKLFTEWEDRYFKLLDEING